MRGIVLYIPNGMIPIFNADCDPALTSCPNIGRVLSIGNRKTIGTRPRTAELVPANASPRKTFEAIKGIEEIEVGTCHETRE